MAEVKVEVKNLKREMFKVRARWLRLQKETVGEALQFAGRPIVEAYRASVPILQTPKRGRIPGLLRQRIGSVIQSKQSGVTTLRIGPLTSRRDKNGPFYARFIEKGFHAVGRARRGTGKGARFIPGRHSLRAAALAHSEQAFTVFKARVIQKFEQDQAAAGAT